MDSKTLRALEYDRILETLAGYCAFSASRERALALHPSSSFRTARVRLEETTEARRFLDTHPDTGIEGARDIRLDTERASRGGVLDPEAILRIKHTLIVMRRLKTALDKANSFPRLAALSRSLPPTLGLVSAISKTLSEKGEILDSASAALASIRAEINIARGRLMNRLQKYLSNERTAAMLQESIITQRDGRYVLPLRADFKGRIKGIVHDQSASGATLFIEPLPVVELNNRVRELHLAERDEIRRILASLSASIAEHARALDAGIDALSRLDLAFAKAKYAEDLDASEPILHPPEEGAPIRLLLARHPLLKRETVVPIDLPLEKGVRALVITGPNTGGKTVTLKTVGLFALMAQSGMHLPAQSGSELPCFHAVYADIGDEQSIEQSLSTFSAHIRNITRILKKADSRSLVILDELGAGTDPQEGAALARAILSALIERGATTFVATHYAELKTFGHTTEGVLNASLEFDIHTLRPTYRLTIGLPGRSNALAIARRLGLPEPVLRAAKEEIHPDDLHADDLLEEIHRQRKLARKERQKAQKARIEAHRLRRELQERLDSIEEERRKILEDARAEAESELRALRAEIQELRRLLRKAENPGDARRETVEAASEEAEKLEEDLETLLPRRPPPISPSLEGTPRVGEKVLVRSLNAEGILAALNGDNAEVQVGNLRVRARLEDLRRKGESPSAPSEENPSAPTRVPDLPAPRMELDLRGKRADEALDALDRYVEQAWLAGMPFVRIIHGKGAGKLRDAVRGALRCNPQVASFEEGKPNEGGAGVTIVHLAPN